MTSRQALRVAERVRRRVAARPFVSRGRDGRPLQFAITVSLGAAGMPEDAASSAALIAAADRGLYAAKHGGRNRAIRYCNLTE